MRRLMVLSLGLLLVPGLALAQKVDAAGTPYRGWDVDTGVGFHNMSHDDGGVNPAGSGDYWNYSWAGTIDVGRFWNSHLKTSTGVTWLQRDYDVEIVGIEVVPGVFGETYVYNDARRLQVHAAATWQFLENAFMHPYVSVGARTLAMAVESERRPTAYVRNAATFTTYPLPPERREYQAVRTRPFVAIGSKSYFSERVYVRPELVIAAGRTGISQVGARLAVGVDF